MEKSNLIKNGADVIKYLANRDSNLGNIARKIEIPEIKNMSDGFSTLVRIIISQQLSGKAADTIHKRFMEFHDISSGFKAPELLPATTFSMRSCGISNSKAIFIQELREKLIHHPDFFQSLLNLNDDELESCLLKIKGVGAWTANILMISFYGRIDVFPKNDTTLNNVLYKVYGIEKGNDKYSSVIDNWRPYRSVAARILWNAYDQKLV